MKPKMPVVIRRSVTPRGLEGQRRPPSQHQHKEPAMLAQPLNLQAFRG